ncbi:MAG: DUF1189 family protein [Acholeplasmataceae bacterium]
MFLLRYFKYSFEYKRIFDRLQESGYKLFVYFLLLSLMSAFPLNYLIVRETGWRLDFIEESFRLEIPEWQLPEDCQIRASKLVCESDETHRFEHRGITYVFNAAEDDVELDTEAVYFLTDNLIYTDGNQASMSGFNYSGFSEPVNFHELNLMGGSDREEAYIDFGRAVEESFGPYIVIYTVLVNTVIHILISIVFILMFALVIQLFRFGYSSFITFSESVKLIVFLMGLPALLSLVIGLFVPAFSTVIYQLSMGIITMLVMLIYGKRRFS